MVPQIKQVYTQFKIIEIIELGAGRQTYNREDDTFHQTIIDNLRTKGLRVFAHTLKDQYRGLLAVDFFLTNNNSTHNLKKNIYGFKSLNVYKPLRQFDYRTALLVNEQSLSFC